MTPSGAATVWLVTSHGQEKLSGGGDERLVDVLRRHGVPWSAVTAYVVRDAGLPPTLCPSLDKRLGEFAAGEQVLLHFNRNVNPFLFSLEDYTLLPSDDPAGVATDYFYQRLDNETGRTSAFLKQLSPSECREVVSARVAETIRAHLPPEADLVVGVSGGGDSNALLHALSRLPDLRVHPVMITGIPDWDLGLPRAKALCAEYGLPLTVLEPAQVEALVGMAPGHGSLVERFERTFGGDDFEFVGTLLIRLALTAHARSVGANTIATGLNLEDVLCEAFFRLASGLQPAGAPKRTVGEVELLFPLWLCPKRIIDGRFPRYSLENYEGRYPCFSLGRNLYYSMVYALQSQFPGMAEQMALGLSKIAAEAPVAYRYDEGLGFHVERFVPFPLRHKFQQMLAGAA